MSSASLGKEAAIAIAITKALVSPTFLFSAFAVSQKLPFLPFLELHLIAVICFIV